MKVLILFFGLLFSQGALAQAKMLEYKYGNQVTGSTLVIESDGSVHHGERTCCPPRTDQLTQPPLSQSELTRLSLLIEGAKLGSQSASAAGQSGYGTSFGHLVVFDMNGVKINIRTIGFGDGAGGPQPIEFNTAGEAREIETLVFEKVLRRMPL